MNITLPNKTKTKIKEKIIFIFIITICVISIILICYNKFWNQKVIDQSSELSSKADEEYNNLKAGFDKIFSNKLENSYDANKINLIDDTKDIVYTSFETTQKSTNNYEMKIHIPYINIDNETIKSYNKEIQQFSEKYNDILKIKNQNIIYDVEYSAYIEEDILSVIIKANLKEGVSAQRIIIQTYNYNLRQNKEVNFIDILKNKNINEEDVQNKINNEIKTAQKNADDLISLGYKIYKRDINDDIYLLNNIQQFYVYNKRIYIIFAYGNDARTSEMDLVIL